MNDFKKGNQPRTNIVMGDTVIWLQTPIVFWLGVGTISLSCSMYMGLATLGRQKHTAEPLVPEPSAFEVELAIEN